ncbi:DDE superfamily endonuclease [Ceratobasidium sp. AG-Ba]|nr:DDE superfamily endonuclease [Ceratobasidium sp. AG-Ba]QRW06332.1 DDE superfamily endonuclease [Ceratobasidium sp. AG-Ba]
MPRQRKKTRSEVVEELLVAGLTLLDSSESGSDEEDRPRAHDLHLPAAPLPVPLPPRPHEPAPFFQVDDLRRFLVQDLDAPLQGFEPYDDDADDADNGLWLGGHEDPALFEPFSDAGDEPFPPFDREGEDSDDILDHLVLPAALGQLDRNWPGARDDEDDEDDEGDRAADELMGLQFLLLAHEYERTGRGPYGQFPKSKDWFDVSMRWPTSWFEDAYRYGSPAFDSNSTISLGVGTVFLYCKRVIRALRMAGLECVAWPNDERKHELAVRFEALTGIPGVIGAGDGSLFGLTSKPLVEGDSYVTYKGSLAINTFCVVDADRRFIAHDGGWAGCKSDRTTFRGANIWECRGELIKKGEILLVDKDGTAGFFTSPYTCRPYDRREVQTGTREEQALKRKFNKRFSKGRIVVEHAFGMIKERFPGVKLMGTSQNIQTNFKALEALIVLHNLCIDYEDGNAPKWYNIEEDVELLAILHRFPGHIDVGQPLREGGWDGHESNEWLITEGRRVREELRVVSQHWADTKD